MTRIGEKTYIFVIIISIFLLIPFKIEAEDSNYSSYLSLKPNDLIKEYRKVKGIPIRFHEIFSTILTDRVIEAEAKGYMQEKYIFFQGKLFEKALYVVNRQNKKKDLLKNLIKDEKVTIYGIIKNIDNIIIEVEKIERGWNIDKFDDISNESHYPKEERKNILKVPYRSGKKKYKLFIPF
ncbi:MAG: hypothetical protein D6734_02420 [Candidatus Schekmanbacteria bacterium]|nr:MAG: hypothetical protein D6734_02420 [Candidatus Schekmanbacteria bacterium]